MSKNIRATFIFCLVASSLFAQQEIGLHFMRDVWQSNTTNPAIVRSKGGVFQIPGLFNGLAFDGPTYNQMVTEENGKSVIEIDRVIDHLKPENLIRDDLSIETFSVAFRLKKLTLSVGHSIKYHAFFKYPKTLPQLIWQGNSQFIGESVNIGNDLQISGYHAMAVGAAFDLNERWTLGVKAKFLSGFTDASTDPDHQEASLYTDPDIYQLTLAGDYKLNTSNSLTYNSYKDLEADFNFGTFTTDKFFDGNTGWAIDIGARYQTEKFDIAASAIDLSNGITWATQVRNYTFNDSIYYEGLNFSQALTGGENANFESALDTLEKIFQVAETNESYSSKMPRKIYLSMLYKLTDRSTIGGVIFNEEFRGVRTTTLGVGGNHDLTDWLNAGITYAVTEDSYDNLGLNVKLETKTLQLFATTDNVLALIHAANGKRFAARIGGNLFF